MVSKQKKAKRKQRQIERQKKNSNNAETDEKNEKIEIQCEDPPEGSTCSHFKQVSVPSLRQAFGSSSSLYCKVKKKHNLYMDQVC